MMNCKLEAEHSAVNFLYYLMVKTNFIPDIFLDMQNILNYYCLKKKLILNPWNITYAGSDSFKV